MDDNDGLLNILIIDDDPSMRELVQAILAAEGHQVISCDSAEQGLEQLPFFTFQVAFLDQNLPGMEGLVLGEYLRSNNPHMAIALVTGETDRRLERVSAEHDIHFVAKPFAVGQILEIVEGYREGARARHEGRLAAADDEFAPRFDGPLGESFDLPKVPSRIEERLFARVRDALANLRSVNRYTERERHVALSGIITARVLGLKLPKGRSGLRYDREFDQIMRQHGRRTEFEGDPDEG